MSTDPLYEKAHEVFLRTLFEVLVRFRVHYVLVPAMVLIGTGVIR